MFSSLRKVGFDWASYALWVGYALVLSELDYASAQVGADEPSPDVSTWAEIRVTTLFTLITATAFLAIFEFGRRNPAVAEVFDRRRASNPHRTPPPLMKNRGLRIFEWVFLSTDPAYTEYALKTQHKVSQEDKQLKNKLKKTTLKRALRDRFQRQKQIPAFRQNNKTKAAATTLNVAQKNREKIIVEEEPPITSGSASPTKTGRKQSQGLGMGTSTKGDNVTAAAAAILRSIQNNNDDPNDDPSALSAHVPTRTLALPHGSGASSPYNSCASSAASRNLDRDSVAWSASMSAEDQHFSNSSASSSTAGLGDDSSSISSSDSRIHHSTNRNHNDDLESGTIPVKSTHHRHHGHRRQNTQSTYKSNILRNSPPQPETHLGHFSNHSSQDGPHPLHTSQHLSPPVHVVTVNQYQIPMGLAEQVITGDVPTSQLQELEKQAQEMIRKQRARNFAAKKIQSGFREARRFSHVAYQNSKNAHSHDAHNQRIYTSRSTLVDEYDYDSAERKEPKHFTRVPPTRKSPVSQTYNQPQSTEGPGTLQCETIHTAASSSFFTQSGPGQEKAHHTVSDCDRSTANASASSADKQSMTTDKDPKPNPNPSLSRSRTMRHLKSTEHVNKRPLDISDQELLRCVGLDTFVMLRFVRFGFDVSFYPFLLGCFILIPVYFTNDYSGTIDTPTDGYFRITMQRLEPTSPRHWVCALFAMCLYGFVLRRLWIEWEAFIPLRFDFLANGDTDITRRDAINLNQYRTSCMVESVPETHRRDRELYEFFDSLFPGQVERAEILLNAGNLTKLIDERRRNIVLYENVYAKHFHKREQYRKKMEKQGNANVGLMYYMCCGFCGLPPKKPQEPQVKILSHFSNNDSLPLRNLSICCRKRMVKALPYYLSEIKRLNREIDKEHKRIHQEKMKSDRKENPNSTFIVSNLQAGAMMFVTGTKSDLNSDTGFVQFKNLTAKQSAIQCNLVGTDNFMVTSSAPDPRDLIWANAIVEKKTISARMLQLDVFFLTGTLFWSAVISGINLFSDLGFLSEILPVWLVPKPESFMAGLVSGYLPIIILEGIMQILLVVLKFVSRNYIHFKTKSDVSQNKTYQIITCPSLHLSIDLLALFSQVDQFVFRWHFGYRLANLCIIIVSGSLIDTIQAVRQSPQAVLDNLARGIATQSQFFLNNIIVSAGSESTWELAQMPKMITHFLLHKIITVEAKSKRYLERLEVAENFNFGEIIPQLLFVFMVSVVYA